MRKIPSSLAKIRVLNSSTRGRDTNYSTIESSKFCQVYSTFLTRLNNQNEKLYVSDEVENVQHTYCYQ